MTKVTYWICDICKKEFRKDSDGYFGNISFEINVPLAFPSGGSEKFNFGDSCEDCRTTLSEAIHSLIK